MFYLYKNSNDGCFGTIRRYVNLIAVSMDFEAVPAKVKIFHHRQELLFTCVVNGMLEQQNISIHDVYS
jgi:dynactin complex subunit